MEAREGGSEYSGVRIFSGRGGARGYKKSAGERSFGGSGGCEIEKRSFGGSCGALDREGAESHGIFVLGGTAGCSLKS